MSPLVAFKKVFLNACILFFVQGKKSVSFYTILQTRTRRKQCSNMKFYISWVFTQTAQLCHMKEFHYWTQMQDMFSFSREICCCLKVRIWFCNKFHKILYVVFKLWQKKCASKNEPDWTSMAFSYTSTESQNENPIYLY